MIFVVTMLWFIFGPPYTIGITVSPDLGKRNGSLYKEYLPYNSSNNVNISLADRNRRLIPYMTFYVPDELPVSQYYTLGVPEQSSDNNQQYQPQQKQVIAIFASHPHHHHQQQMHVHEPHFHNVRPASSAQPKYPIQRPQQQYHAIMYGTRHQIPNKHFPSNHQDHLPVPISYKQSNIFKVPQNQHTPMRLNPSPFRPENKVPGPFIPIVYPDHEDHSERSKTNLPPQNSDISSAYFIQEQILENNGRPKVPQIQTVEASTSRPLYPILNEINIEPVQQQVQVKPQQPLNRVPSHEDHRQLTPEEKYVVYLEEQLIQKQRQHQKHQKFQPQIQQNPVTPAPQLIVVSSSVAPLPDNQILYQEQPEKVDYKKLVPTYHSSQYSQPPQQYPPSENQQNYIEYVEPEQHQQIIEIPANIRVATGSPIVSSSVIPVFMNHQQVQSQRLKPVAQSHLTNQHFYKQEKRPVYIHKPTNMPQIVRQHLTETTQVPTPTLTTYHPTLSTTLKPAYGLYQSTEKPLKLKPSQRYKPIVVTNPVPSVFPTRHSQPTASVYQRENPLPDFRSSSLADILKKLQDSNHLPHTLTPDNIDNSIRTLIKILNNLKQSQTIVENPPQHHDEDYEYDDVPPPSLPQSEPGPNSGRPGIDYPTLAEIPQTNFNCKEQRYKGFFGDPDTHCQVWHYCDLNGGQASFLCPNGTIFSQVALTCDWWFNVKCSSTAQLYVLNERLYKYILPFTPKFPEDYSGPLVDKYLALKFKEMEEKMKREKMKGKQSSEEEDEENEEENDDEQSDNVQNSTEKSVKDDNKSSSLSSSSNEKDDADDDGQNRGSIDTGIPISAITSSTEASVSMKPIIVTSTGLPFSSHILSVSSTTPKTNVRTSVESEKVEVIEIKTDGTSGHLTPHQNYPQQM